ncbi:MAG: creatininase family protein [Anaerolineae bacterium]|nr:creatininase family protein [Anaerolineae bacterium]
MNYKISPIHYADLTWPEVADLPRDLPLVLPLGEGFAAESIAAALGVPALILLPPLPYGWPGSIVPVSLEMLRRVIGGIFSGPREDGFQRCLVVHDQAGLSLPDSVTALTLPRQTAPTLTPPAATPQRVILIPCGHTEQHGYHLPMNTDTVIIGAMAEAVAAAIPDEAETLPVLPYGVSMYRSSFAGTLNLGGRVFEDFLLEVIDVLVARGADRFYLMSGHGGNSSFLHNTVKYAGDRHQHIFAATTWLHTSGHLGAPALEQYRRSPRGGMGHACELETAYLLHLRPDLCKMDRVVDELDFISTPNYYMDWIEGGALILTAMWEDDTLTGAYGSGSLATAEVGARWFAIAVEEKIVHVREIHEQARLRLVRRADQQRQNLTPATVLARQPWQKKG